MLGYFEVTDTFTTCWNNVGGNLDVVSNFNFLVHFNYVVIPSKFNTHSKFEVVEGIEYEFLIKENVQINDKDMEMWIKEVRNELTC
jgi:hypothetical protein